MSLIQDHCVEVSGKGERVLVFAHGYGCDRNMWRSLTAHLENDYKIVLYDLMGSGGSDPAGYDREKYSTLQGHADDLADVLNELGLGTVTLVGHSVSAMTVALTANALGDRVDDVIMICPSPSFINEGAYHGGFEREDILELLATLENNYLGWSQDMAPAIMGTPTMPEHGETLTTSFCQADPDIARHFAKVTFLSDHRADMRDLKHRTLILECHDDVIVPPSVGEWMDRTVENGTLVTLDATGHCPHISFPVETAVAMRGFLDAA